MEKRHRTVFICQHCGRESIRWLGRCPDCNGWNTFVETSVGATDSGRRTHGNTRATPQKLSLVRSDETPRLTLSLEECNRVLGGGIVPGSLVLIGGDPGIGKSTLLLQVAAALAESGRSIVYVSGEESPTQLKLRADRLGIAGRESLFILPETNMDSILAQLADSNAGMVIVDSIQTVYLDSLDSPPGSVGQIRECAMKLMQWAKTSNTPVMLSGHVTKDGAIAGPRVLEHIVDAVLYLEGEPFGRYRLLRSVKNRFGSTNEVGVFEMRNTGLVEVTNPSATFLSERPSETLGSAVVSTLEGSRPLLVEIQALTTITSFGLPRRTANGVDFNRMLLIIAVLSKRAGLSLGNQDVMVNVVGGLKISEPAADLGIALAVASSFREVPIDPGLVAIGEVGLSGELRAVPNVDRRLAEAAKLGFQRCLLPKPATGFVPPRDIHVVGVTSLKEALREALPKRGAKTAEA